MDCGNCGAHNPRGNEFCVKCGARLQPAPAEPAEARQTPDPERAQQLLEQAFRYSDQGLLAEAIETCRQATIANPSSTSAHSFLGILYERAGEREKAIREYELALSLSPESVAERESLDQLAREAAAPPILPRPARRLARAALIGAFVAVSAVLVAAIFLTYGRSRGVRATVQPEASYPYPAPVAPAPAPVEKPSALEATTPTPAAPRSYPRVYSPLQPSTPAYSVSPRPTPLPAPKPARIVLPKTGRVVKWRPPAALTRPPAPAPVPVERPSPFERARASLAAPEPLVAAPQVARQYYFGREYDRAINVYERMLLLRPDGAAPIREELAWCYYQASRTRDALAQYRRALAGYETQLERGVDPKGARLGIRTCRAAIEALSAQESR